MAKAYLAALRASSMRSCRACMNKRLVFTDHDVKDMVKTKQGYLCRDHYKEAQEKRRKAKLHNTN